MPVKCCIFGCKSSSWKTNGNNKTITRTFPEDKKNSFHSFPKKKKLCYQWMYCIEACIGQTSFGRNPRVCSAHFKETDIEKRKQNFVLTPSSVPTIFRNSNYVDYEVLYPENKENMESDQPTPKKKKFDVEHLNSKKSSRFFFPPLVLAADDISMSDISPLNELSGNVFDSVEDMANCNDLIQASDGNDTSPIKSNHIKQNSEIVTFVPDHVLEPTTTHDIQMLCVESFPDINVSIANTSSLAVSFINNSL